jgi:hypothetical protein
LKSFELVAIARDLKFFSAVGNSIKRAALSAQTVNVNASNSMFVPR